MDSDLFGAYFTMLAVLFLGLAVVAVVLAVRATRFAARRMGPSRPARGRRLVLIVRGAVLFLLLMIPAWLLTATLAFSW